MSRIMVIGGYGGFGARRLLAGGHEVLVEGRFTFGLDLVHQWLRELVHRLAVFADCEVEA